MSKDLFEIRIKEQLSNMKAPVPEGSWASIKSQIPSAGSSAAGGGSISSFSFGLGIVTGATILASLGVYSELKQPAQSESQNLQTTRIVESNPNVIEQDETAQVVSFEKAERLTQTEPMKEVTDQVVIGDDAEAMENKTTEKSAIEVVNDENPDAFTEQSTPIAPISKIDSNGLDTESSLQESGDRNPISSSPASLPVESTPNFTAEIVSSATEGYAPFTVSLHNTGELGESYWEINGRTSRGNMVESTFEEPGTYSVYLTVYDSDGSIEAEDEIEILVKEGSDIKLPNIFTPNGDGLNDTYRIGYAKNIAEFFIQITDETGRVVYTSSDIGEEWVYDQNSGINNMRYTVQYRAIGVDGKVHTDQFPLIIVRD